MMENQEVTLSEVLDAREERAKTQTRLIDMYRVPLISFTVVTPGPVKQNESFANLFSEGVAELDEKLAEKGFGVRYREIREKKTGSEAIYAVDADVFGLKRLAVGIEDTHRHGRLFDIDVVDVAGVPLSRSVIGMPPRKCLLCGRDARICARLRAHPAEELLREIERIAGDE